MTYPVSIKAVLLHRDRVLLLLNERGEWDLPGGRPEPHEDAPAVAVREVREETGLAVAAGARLGEYLFEVLPGRFVRIVALACDLSAEAEVRLSHEHRDLCWLSLAALDEAADGPIAGHPLPDCYRAAITAARARSAS